MISLKTVFTKMFSKVDKFYPLLGLNAKGKHFENRAFTKTHFDQFLLNEINQLSLGNVLRGRTVIYFNKNVMLSVIIINDVP